MNKLLITLAAASALSPSVLAEQRSGFYLSGGLGISSNKYEEDWDSDSHSFSNAGLATSFKIGGYLSPNMALYYQREASFWQWSEADANIYGGLTGIGATYYFQPSRGPYVAAGIGLGDIVFEDTGDVGLGMSVGAGYEFSDHIQLGVVYTYTSVEESYYLSDREVSTTAFSGKIEFKL